MQLCTLQVAADEQPLSLLCPVPSQGHWQGWLRIQHGLNPPHAGPREPQKPPKPGLNCSCDLCCPQNNSGGDKA